MSRRMLLPMLLILLAGCGSRVTMTSAERRAAAAGGVGAKSAARAAAASAAATRAPKATTAAPSITAAVPGTTERNAANHIAMEIVLPACIERGRAATATVRTVPAALIAASAAYADDEAHGDTWFGTTDARGEYRIVWTPPPDAPLGKAKILAGANSESRGGATVIRHFLLAAPGGCA